MQEPNEELSRRHLRRQAGDQAAPDASGDVTMTRQESLSSPKRSARRWPLGSSSGGSTG
ncbi:hypothetical protein QPX96_06940 [Limosilactobacillus fermentum]|nr:hypothetical protein [Limosilactobacillus fermentum]